MFNIKFKKLDDEMHFWAGMVIMLFIFIPSTFVFTQWLAAVIGFLSAGTAAILKELYDKHIKKTRFDWRDVRYTLFGASIFTIIFIVGDITYYYSKP